mmetsp:Transcript_30044/g.47979  ORF Transcript_30044/g.47979 Transcript_30044/m.47979 type:complete len:1184 (-) Transcript_30044:396-3947(-)|eukprot:CAMPEP_0197025794 /NCGR_PEP_ID=MMETSP1384-20130603/6013_1 /TAXON_ID=29189 /ORGANISM="Ammonia sp." /LENGTH=1183 /DNA_ID=CAMNT_0042454365 /DNA_START=220 /DNA_END=3771 /DNA_ORIENTATION=-
MASEETNAATATATDNSTEQAASAEDASATQSEQPADSTTTATDAGAGSNANDPNKDLNLPEDPTKTTVHQQRVLMKRLGEKVQIAGDQWYPIDKKWYDSWKAYTMWSKADDDIPDGGLEDSGIPRPGKIDNEDLQDPSNPAALRKDIQENRTHVWVHEDVWKLLQSWYGGGPAFPRKVYERGSTYVKEKYICIYPQLVKLVYCDDKTGKIDTSDESKIVLKQFPPDYTLKQMAKDLEDEMELKDDDKKEDTPYVHVWLKFGQVKLIYTIDKKVKVTEEDLADVDPEKWVEVPDDYLKTKLDDIALNQEEPQAAAPTDSAAADNAADDANAATDATAAPTEAADNKQPEEEAKTAAQPAAPKEFLIAIERKQEDGTWPRAKGDDWKETIAVGDILDVRDEQEKWYETVIRLVGKPDTDHAGKFIVHYIGWNIKWDEWVEIDSERVEKRHTNTKAPHRPRKQTNYGGGGGYYDSSFSFWQNEQGPPDQRGVVGLRNLGNTCFMNSTIQCLAQSPQLTDYFLNGDYKHHVNTNNPLGWGGRVAKAWAHLLQEMFSGQYRVIAPRQFKSAIGEVAPRFMGYAQQDSQELLSFLLDGLHEDLNQIQQKPATEGVESKGRPDKVVAMEAWKTYLKRNQSVIVDLMQGQYKSKVVCPDCHRVSITFDPYMFLSVPLPTERHKVVEYTWIDADTSKPPTVFGQKMLKVADIQMLKESVAKKQGVEKDELFVCDIWKSKIHRELRRHDSVSDINRKSDDIFIYHSPRPNMEEWKQAQPEVEKADGADKDPAAEDAEKPAAGAEPAGGAGDDEDERDGGNRGPPADPEVNGAGGNYYGGGRYNYGRQAQKKQKAEYQTFVVNNQHRVQARQQYMNAQQRFEDEPIGYPLLVTLPMQIPVSKAQIRKALWKLIQPFLRDENLTLEDELPFEFWAAWGFDNHQKIDDTQTVFELNQRNLKFLVHWKDVNQYKSELYSMQNRERDETAPPPLDPNHVSSIGFDDDDRRGRGKPIDLTACLEAFCEKETLSENDAWYCSKCKDFKCASKKIDLWNAPDLLIIHLKRFSYTRNWRDRINTLVRFPIDEGLDLSNFLNDRESAQDAIYDLYAVSNHMGGMGGGHYTAYAKNLDNSEWYHLDDSRTSKVNNPASVVSSAAYVLYYYKRNPRKLKHRASRIDIAAIEKQIQEQTNEETPQ